MALSLFFTGPGFEFDGVPYHRVPIFLEPNSMKIELLPTEWILFQAVVRGSARSPGTWRNYASNLLDWLRYSDQNGWNWRRPEERLLAHYRNSLERRKPDVSAQTIARKMLIVCWFYEWARTKGHLRDLPIDFEPGTTRSVSRRLLAHLNSGSASARRVLVPHRSTRERLPRFFTKAEQTKILDQLSMRDRLMVLWALQTGIREAELCALTCDQIPDQDSYRSVRLYRLQLRVTKGSVGGDLFVPTWLLDETYRYIALFERRFVTKQAQNRGTKDTQYIWLSRWGRPLRPNSIYQSFKKALKKAGIPDGTFHDLRHTYAITMLDRLMTAAEGEARARNPLLVLKHLMRHATLSSTEIYLRAREFYLSDIFQDCWDMPEVA